MWLIPCLSFFAGLFVVAFMIAPRDELRDLINDMEIYTGENMTSQWDLLRADIARNATSGGLGVDIYDLKTDEVLGFCILLAWIISVCT